MQNEPASHFSRIARWTPLLAAAFVSFVLLFLNLDGYRNELYDGDFSAKPPNSNWVHGWPFRLMVRHSIYPTSGVWTSERSFNGPHGVYSRWPFDEAPVTGIFVMQLVVDIILFLFLVGGTYFGASRLRTSFGLKSLFFAMTMSAIFCAVLASSSNGRILIDVFRTPKSPAIKWRCAVQVCALSVIAIAAMLSVHAAIAGSSSFVQRHWLKRRD